MVLLSIDIDIYMCARAHTIKHTYRLEIGLFKIQDNLFD